MLGTAASNPAESGQMDRPATSSNPGLNPPDTQASFD
jgi:hypothetical protein